MTPGLLRSMLLVFTASIIGSFGAVFLKLGAHKLTKSLFSFFNLNLAFGVALFLGSSVFYALGIRGGQLSVLYPMVSLGYIWTLLWSRLFFKEPFTRQKFLGLGLILLGVFFVGLGSS
ncbi:MAG TPA: EamA family transporter [Bryobacteraceae bacterium]|jgi:drug/metabolite transporter (DMT)-like permease|nr:EamA family transporter [Bryobacteraceae bacterium]